jgi:hypothetical protein
MAEFEEQKLGLGEDREGDRNLTVRRKKVK